MEGRADEARISPVDAATLGLSVHGGQPYLIVLGGLLEPGGFVDASGRPDVARLRAILEARVARLPVLTHRPTRRDAARAGGGSPMGPTSTCTCEWSHRGPASVDSRPSAPDS